MELINYKTKIRKYRGHLTSMDVQLETIWEFGSEKFKDYSLSSKTMGIQKMANIADSVSLEDQDDLVVWLLEKTRCKPEIDIKLLSLI